MNKPTSNFFGLAIVLEATNGKYEQIEKTLNSLGAIRNEVKIFLNIHNCTNIAQDENFRLFIKTNNLTLMPDKLSSSQNINSIAIIQEGVEIEAVLKTNLDIGLDNLVYGDTKIFFQDEFDNEILLRRPVWSPYRFVAQNYFWDFCLLKLDCSDTRYLSIRELPQYFEQCGLKINELIVRKIDLPLTKVTARRDEIRKFLDRKSGQIQSSRFEFSKISKSDENFLSIIIPTAFVKNSNNEFLIERCIKSFSNYLSKQDEVIVISGDEDDFGCMERIANSTDAALIWIKDDDSPFNYSRRVNIGGILSRGKYLIFLNDDVEFFNSEDIGILLNWTSKSDVGAVGALLFDSDGRIQHAGHVYQDGDPYHAYYSRKEVHSLNGDLQCDYEVSGVTAAVLATKREIWEAVGGFTLKLPGNYNDVDFCLKISQLGLSIIMANSVKCLHNESSTRDPKVLEWESDFIKRRWSHKMTQEKYLFENSAIASFETT